MNTIAKLLFVLICNAALAGNELVINWQANPSGESNLLYRVYLSTNSTNTFVVAGSTTDTSLVLSNLAPAAYGVSLTASNMWGESARSAPVYTAGPYALPSVPGGINVFFRFSP